MPLDAEVIERLIDEGMDAAQSFVREKQLIADDNGRDWREIGQERPADLTAFRGMIAAIQAPALLKAARSSNTQAERIGRLEEAERARLAWIISELEDEPNRPLHDFHGSGPLCRNGHEVMELELEQAQLELKAMSHRAMAAEEALRSAQVVIDYASERLWDGRPDAVRDRPVHVDQALRTTRAALSQET